jgi:hypothetical protein
MVSIVFGIRRPEQWLAASALRWAATEGLLRKVDSLDVSLQVYGVEIIGTNLFMNLEGLLMCPARLTGLEVSLPRCHQWGAGAIILN